ncbi:MAG: DUF4173 domain-containing protein [Blautia sp.]|nr:DUF4173 domain-containing protein [Blautia sp.]MCM1199859.1 DUF4173 domain-containing protein [Bacteroides fragilis]
MNESYQVEQPNACAVNNYFRQEEAKKEEAGKEETILTRQMKKQFSFFGPSSALYALFYAFCLYRNASGITYPFFVAGTLCYFFLSMKKLGVPYKKDSLFYIVSVSLLGISNCCTDSPQLLWMNKLGIFLLTFILILHTVYYDADWNLPKYLGAILRTIGNSFVCLFSPLSDLASFYDAQKQKKSGKKNYILYILLGFSVSIPLLIVMTLLLCSADIVFRNIIENLLCFDISFTGILRLGFTIAAVFFVSYALLSALCRKTVSEEVPEKKKGEPIIAITVSGMLSVVYLLFSFIQIFYLFIGNMKLPEGYTYAAYARQGFFQLLAVCIINLILVLLCLYFFRDNLILKIILSIVSGCTFIMILSSALRMLMYISAYNLTFLRLFVIWSLIVIFLLMTGVTVYIYFQRFPLFFYSVAVVTVFYTGLSFSHPDYWIARYNLNPSHTESMTEYDAEISMRYLSTLSADAAPALLNENTNPFYVSYTPDGAEHWINMEYWMNDYCRRIAGKSDDMGIRNFNFSIFYAAGRGKF